MATLDYLCCHRKEENMVKTYSLKAMLCIALAFCFCGIVQAQVIFEDNFDNVNALSVPSPDPNVPTTAHANVGFWQRSTVDPNRTAMGDPNNSAAVLNGSVPGAYNGPNYLYLNRFGPGGTTPFGSAGATAHFSEVSVDKTFISFACNNASGVHELWVYDSNDPGTARTVITVRFSTNGTVQNNDFGTWLDTGLIASPGVWHDVRIVIDFGASSYDLYVDGLKSAGLSLAGFSSQAGSMEFYLNPVSLPSTMYLDKVKVESGTAACSVPLQADLNGDCKVNFADFARLAQNWLVCNLTPASGCSL
jgi:hypothetical protein